jgi:hypothetical protein
MDPSLARALIAAARVFADELERGLLWDGTGPEPPPVAGTPRSMLAVLSSLATVNDDERRGATGDEMREIARRAGMDPRGMAGYYRADLIEQRDDGTRWISSGGRERLSALRGVRILAETPTSEP